MAMEAAPGLEPGITVLQTVALASWLCRPPYKYLASVKVSQPDLASGSGPAPTGKGYENGAGNETRTRDSYLGKVVLYQLSYARSEG